MTIDDQDGGDRVDDGDDPEDGECRPSNPPEPLAIRTKCGPNDIRRPRTTEDLFRDDGRLVASRGVCVNRPTRSFRTTVRLPDPAGVPRREQRRHATGVHEDNPL